MALAEPQIVLPLLLPAQRSARAVDLEPEIVLVPRTDLADVDRALRAALEAHENRREILRLDLEGFARADRLLRRERLGRFRGSEPRCDHGGQVGEHFDDAPPGDVLDEIAPVRSDVADRRARAALLGLE